MKPLYVHARRPVSLALLLFAGLMLAGAGAQADAGRYGKWKAVKVKLEKIKSHKSQRGGLPALEERVAALEAGAADLSALEGRVGVLEVEVAALQADVGGLAGLPDRVASLEVEIAAVNAALAGLNDAVTDLGGDLSVLSARVADVEAALAGFVSQADFDTLESRVSALESSGGGGGGGGPTGIDVDCAAGDSIAAALADGDPARPLTITLLSGCTEEVAIRRDDVTLQGASGAALTGGILVDGSSRVAIRDLDILNGSGVGVHLDKGASADLSNLFIAGHVTAGLKVSRNSVADASGVEVNTTATGAPALHVADSSDLTVQFGTNPFSGAVIVENNSNADLGSSGLFSGLTVSGHSRARLVLGNVPFGGVMLSRDSMLEAEGSNIGGTVNCTNAQNLVVNISSFMTINPPCTVE